MISAKKMLYKIVEKISSHTNSISSLNTWKTARSKTFVAYSDGTTSLSTSDKNIPLTSVSGLSGHGATISGAGVKVPTAGAYLISAAWLLDNLGSSGNTLTCTIKRGSTSITSAGVTHTGGYYYIDIPQMYVSLNANEVLYLSARNNTSAVGRVTWAQILVERIA